MPIKSSGTAENVATVDRFDGGVGWIAYPDESMRRASHAVTDGSGDDDADVWVVDPVDGEGVDDLLADLGEVRGVLVLMDRHSRDAADIAARHDVPVSIPECVDLTVDAPTERISRRLPGTDYEIVETIDWPGWTEAALYDGDTLLVGDAVGTADYFTTSSERVGVHPMVRIKPPSALRQFEPERILCGHGTGVMADGTETLQYALNGARRRAPAVWVHGLRSFLSG